MTAVTGTILKARSYSSEGKAGKEFQLPSNPFDGVVHEESVHDAVKAYLANQRQGTASAKNRSAVRGGGRKPWRQKGTGRARHGTIRSPIWRGGGVVFPPTPRSYRQKLPKKVRHLARRSALNARAVDERVLVLDELAFDAPKTRRLRELLEKLEIFGSRILVLTNGERREVYLSARNIPDIEVRAWGSESVYDVVQAEYVVIERGALEAEGTSERASDSRRDETSDTGEADEEVDDA